MFITRVGLGELVGNDGDAQIDHQIWKQDDLEILTC